MPISIGLSIIALFVSAISAVSMQHYYHNEGQNISTFAAIRMDREIQRANRGYITTKQVAKAIKANQQMIANNDNYYINQYGKFLKDEAYMKYILPYKSIHDLINLIYEDDIRNISKDSARLVNINNRQPIDNLTLCFSFFAFHSFKNHQVN